MTNTMLTKIDFSKDPDELLRINEGDLIKAIKIAQSEGEKIGYSKAIIALAKITNDITPHGYITNLVKYLETNQGEFLGE